MSLNTEDSTAEDLLRVIQGEHSRTTVRPVWGLASEFANDVVRRG